MGQTVDGITETHNIVHCHCHCLDFLSCQPLTKMYTLKDKFIHKLSRIFPDSSKSSPNPPQVLFFSFLFLLFNRNNIEGKKKRKKKGVPFSFTDLHFSYFGFVNHTQFLYVCIYRKNLSFMGFLNLDQLLMVIYGSGASKI